MIKGDCQGCELLPKGSGKKRFMQLGRLDILVNNAAFQVHTRDIEDRPTSTSTKTLKDESLRLLLHGKGRYSAFEERLGNHQHRVRHGPYRLEGAAGLLHDQGGNSCLHPVLFRTSLFPKVSRVKRRRARPGLDASQSSDKEAEDVEKFGSQTR